MAEEMDMDEDITNARLLNHKMVAVVAAIFI